MKRYLTILMMTLLALSLLAPTAEAKRFGGGGSLGKQRTMTPQPAPKAPAAAPAPAPNAAGAAPAAKPAGNKWLGPLAGLAIGAGLAAMFAHFGLGEGMGTLLMIMLVIGAVLLLVSMLRRKAQPEMQYAGTTQYAGSAPAGTLAGGADYVPGQAKHIPADFPVESFLRSAKTSFIRLQAANDRKDLNDIREYTTPEMYAEIAMQTQERGNAVQKTDVVTINAELLEVAYEGDMAIASVRFTGTLAENNGAPEAFDEIWHVQKDLRDNKAVWLLAGIQQTELE